MTQAAGLGSFRNVQGSLSKDYVIESIGGGCAFIDYNRDGNPDILLVRGTTLERYAKGGDLVVALYENRGGGTFVDVTGQARLLARGWGMGVSVADYDNDGWPDFLVTGFGRNFLFHNERDGTFTERAREAGVAREGVWSTGAAFGDLDGDGFLDLYISAYVTLDLNELPRRGSNENCRYKGAPVFCGPRGLEPAPHAVFRNGANGKFIDVTKAWGFDKAAPPFYGLQVLIADYDGDGLQDIFVANDSTPNYLFHNEGSGRFREIAVQSGVAVNADGREQASMGADFGDFDGDGRLDLIVTTFSEDTKTLYKNLGDGTFMDVSWPSKIGPPSWLFLSWGAKFVDADNDGLLDLFIANGHVYPDADRFHGGSTYRQRFLLHRNLGNGTFEEIGARDKVLSRPGTARGLAVADFDNDGDMDILINHQDSGPQLLRNDAPAGNHWLHINLEGRKSNRDGIGTIITLRTASRSQTAVRLGGDSYLSSSEQRVHFGLGKDSVIAELRVRWPSGTIQRMIDLQADRTVAIQEQ